MQGRSWNGYCQIPALGRDPSLRSRPGLVEVGVSLRPGSEVVTWSALVRQKQRRDMDMMSRHGWQCGRSRPGFLVSPPGKPIVGRNGVAT